MWAKVKYMNGHLFWYPWHVGWSLSEDREVSLQEGDEIRGLLRAELSAYLHFLFRVVGMDDYLVILLGSL